MSMLDPQKFTMEQRKSIMMGVVDAKSQLYQRDVLVQDFNTDNSKLTLVDFGKSLVGRSYDPFDPEEGEQYLPGTYISPILRWAWTNDWFSYPCAFKKWTMWD